MSIELVMPSNHPIICCPFLLLPSIFPSIRDFFNESVLHTRWSKYWSFSISPSNEYSGLISFRIDLLDLFAWSRCSPRLSRVFSGTTVWKHQFFSTQLSSLWSRYSQITSYRTLCWPSTACDGLGMAAWFWGSDLENSLAQRHQAHFPQQVTLPPICFTHLSYFPVDSNPGGKRVLTSGAL